MIVFDIAKLCDIFEKATHDKPDPMSVALVREYGCDPYLILISCLLSLRARDGVTYQVSKELFNYVKTPHQMIDMPLEQLLIILKPLGFYRKKSLIIKEVSYVLIDRFHGQVPSNEHELLSIRHIGQKTTNLVLSMAFQIPAICVDTHVHRIANHIGLVKTKRAEDTEKVLKKIAPRTIWMRINYAFVKWGQYVCKPNTKECRCHAYLSLHA